MGLSIKETTSLIDAPKEIFKPAIERKIENLEMEIAKKKLVI